MKRFTYNKLSVLGILLILSGSLLIGVSFFGLVIFSTTPIGILIGLVGTILLIYPNSQTPSEESEVLIGESLKNIEAMLKSFGASQPCYYLPPKEGKMYVFIPLGFEASPAEAWDAMNAPLVTLTQIKNKPGLTIITPFSFILKYLNTAMSIDEALSRIIIDQFEVAESIKASRLNDEFSVEISQPLTNLDLPLCEKILGSFTSLLAGCILSAQINKPLVLVNETHSNAVLKCRFKVPDYE
jgi:hypothetical protein